MALLFCDSAGHYDTANRLKKWSVATSLGVVSDANSRFSGASCLYCTNAYPVLRRTLPSSYTTLIVGFAFRWGGGPNGEAMLALLTAGGLAVLSMRAYSPGDIDVCTGAYDGPALTTITGELTAGVWSYWEVKTYIHASAGTVEVRKNGSVVYSGTGLNTAYRGGSVATYGIGFSLNQDVSSEPRWSDIYVCDTSGSTNNDFLGDIRVQTLLPSGNGTWSGFTGSDGNQVDNYALVDEAAPDTADYVQSFTPGDKDTYAYSNLTPTTGTVYGIQVVPYAAKTDAGTVRIVPVARLSGGTEEDGAEIYLDTTPVYYRQVLETKPGGGSWSITDVNGAEFGVKVGGS